MVMIALVGGRIGISTVIARTFSAVRADLAGGAHLRVCGVSYFARVSFLEMLLETG